ncbi:MAG: deoxyguanosinetriphosphate triphosphohydrolase [candidate division Zixibacteria bacterium]|nr:deoxyguanosinetriphosphate triphosphohydrolase [candidate division Zixibacteria bacterium]
MLIRERMENTERETLAPYAMKSADSQGRVHPMSESSHRTCFQRDCDRIIHSKAFRRMEYKTQVFVNSEGDHYRTRLTHTIEVSQVCRSVARSLALNESLAEAIALAHDLGHTPFGHAGEEALDNLLSDSGGFNHNTQSLKIVDQLESRYPDYPGLNLSYEVREGIARHETSGAKFDETEFPPGTGPSLEASIVDIADQVAYNSHDIDDALANGLIEISELETLSICRREIRKSASQYPRISAEMRRYDLVRRLVSRQIGDLVASVTRALEREGIDSLEKVRQTKIKLVAFSESLNSELAELRTFLAERVYAHPRVKAMADEGSQIIHALFSFFSERPERIPDNAKAKLNTESTPRLVADYIAGMTDRFAEIQYQKLQNGVSSTSD